MRDNAKVVAGLILQSAEGIEMHWEEVEVEVEQVDVGCRSWREMLWTRRREMSELPTCASFRAASFSSEFLSSAARALQARSEEASAISSAIAALDALSAASLAATCSKRSSWPQTASVRRQWVDLWING